MCLSNSYRAVEILGEFDLYPKYGDKAGAWAPLKGNCPNDKEWIEVIYKSQMLLLRSFNYCNSIVLTE